MLIEDYRDLFGLLIEGAVARSQRGDPGALDIPARLMVPLGLALRPDEIGRFLDGIEAERVAHERLRGATRPRQPIVEIPSRVAG